MKPNRDISYAQPDDLVTIFIRQEEKELFFLKMQAQKVLLICIILTCLGIFAASLSSYFNVEVKLGLWTAIWATFLFFAGLYAFSVVNAYYTELLQRQ